jgi:hypothetical protein
MGLSKLGGFGNSNESFLTVWCAGSWEPPREDVQVRDADELGGVAVEDQGRGREEETTYVP